MFHIHFTKLKNYFSYSLKKKGIYINLILSRQLKYSNNSIAIKELQTTNSIQFDTNDIVNVVHVTQPLDYNQHHKSFQIGNCFDKTSLSKLDTSIIPLTILSTLDRLNNQKVYKYK